MKNNPQKENWKPTEIYPTNYESIYVAIITGGFGLRSERNLGKERNGATQLFQYIPPTEDNGFAEDNGSAFAMHMTRNTSLTKPAVKICTWLWTTKCTWEQNSTTSSSIAHDYFKPLRYNSWKANVSKKEHRSLIFWCYLLKTHAPPPQDKC